MDYPNLLKILLLDFQNCFPLTQSTLLFGETSPYHAFSFSPALTFLTPLVGYITEMPTISIYFQEGLVWESGKFLSNVYNSMGVASPKLREALKFVKWFTQNSYNFQVSENQGGLASLILPYSDKMKQLLKMIFLLNEQNVSVMCTLTSTQYH